MGQVLDDAREFSDNADLDDDRLDVLFLINSMSSTNKHPGCGAK